MVTPPGIPKISVRTPTSPAPELSLTKSIVTKELGKPTTSASVSRVLAAPVSEAIAQARNWPSPKSKAWDPKFDNAAPKPWSPTRPNKALHPGAYNFRPIAQTREEMVSVAKYNKNSNDTGIPNAEIGLSRIKFCPVVEDKAKSKLQGPMWPGPVEVVTADAAAADAWSLVSLRHKKGKATATNLKAATARSHDNGTLAVDCSSNGAADANAAVAGGLARDDGIEATSNIDDVEGFALDEARTAAASNTINIFNNKNREPTTTAAEGSSAKARVALEITNSDSNVCTGPIARVGTAKLDYLLANITKARDAIAVNPDKNNNRHGAMPVPPKAGGTATATAAIVSIADAVTSAYAVVASASEDAESPNNNNGTTAKWGWGYHNDNNNNTIGTPYQKASNPMNTASTGIVAKARDSNTAAADGARDGSKALAATPARNAVTSATTPARDAATVAASEWTLVSPWRKRNKNYTGTPTGAPTWKKQLWKQSLWTRWKLWPLDPHTSSVTSAGENRGRQNL